MRRLIIIKTTIAKLAKIQSIQRVQTSYKNKISQLALLFEILGGVFRGDGAIAPPLGLTVSFWIIFALF